MVIFPTSKSTERNGIWIFVDLKLILLITLKQVHNYVSSTLLIHHFIIYSLTLSVVLFNYSHCFFDFVIYAWLMWFHDSKFKIDLSFSELNGVRQTDSMSNLSDMSGNTAVQTTRPRMDVACVIDTVQPEHLAHRKCAFDELKQACSLTNANFHQIQVIKIRCCLLIYAIYIVIIWLYHTPQVYFLFYFLNPHQN